VKPYIAVAMVLAWVVGNPAAARADADEASVQAGLTIVGAAADNEAIGRAELMAAAGMSGRLTYATSDWYAFEAALELEHSTGLASFTESGVGQAEDVPGETFVRRMGWLRGEAGISARLGVRWIPTFYAGLGVQAQLAGVASDVRQGLALPGPDNELTLGMIGAVGAGLDYRVDEHWIMGVSLRARRSAPWGGGESYSSIGFTLHVGYYWYPGNMAWSSVGKNDKRPRR
jgi:hypothetical protein